MRTGQEPGGVGPDIACVIPTHGRPDLLLRAVRSVLDQSLAPSEIVVVDDLQDPEVERRLEALQDGRVSYVRLDPEGEGTAGASRNAGATAATTSLLAFLDDDDVWDRRFLEATVEALERGRTDMAVTWNRLERDGRTLDVLRRMPERLDREMLPAVNPGLTGSNFLIRRPAFERIGGFDASLPVFNDLDLLVRFIDGGGRYSVVPEQLVTQFSHGGEQLSSRSPRRAAGIRQYLAKHRPRLRARAYRRILREIWMTERHPGQRLPLRVGYFVLSWAVAEPQEVLVAVRRRVRRQPRAY